MPSVQQGEKKDHYMHRCVPLLIKEGKKQDQAVAQCLNMFKEHWQAKGNAWPSTPEEINKIIASFNWEDCPECVEMERKITGVWEFEIVKAKHVIKCDSCRETIDLSKPKAGEPPNEGISAVLNAGTDIKGISTTKQYHFCGEGCLYDFLKKRNKK